MDAGLPKAKLNAYRRPGLNLFASTGPGPVTALFAQDGRAFCVSGSVFWEVFASGNVLARGFVNPSPIAATINSNGTQGHQLLITSGGSAWIFDLVTSVFTKLTGTVDGFPDKVIGGMFSDSSFLVLNQATGQFNVSGLFDGLTWNNLDVGIESQVSDKTVMFLRSHDNIILFGSRNTAIWVNSGVGGAAGYVPQPGTIIEHGILAPFTALELDNTAWWLGQDAQGAKQVWRLDGYTPQRVSTFAVEADIARVGDAIYNSVAFPCQEQGHTWYVLYIPTIDTSWAYDVSCGLWTEWGHWDTVYGRFFPYRVRNHAYGFGKHLVGDGLSGAIFSQSFDNFSDVLP